MPLQLDPRTCDFYCRALTMLEEAGVPFLVGGAYALERYTGIERHTKDFDIFVRPADAARTLDLFAEAGYATERTHPHWLGKVRSGEAFVDIIYRSGNGVVEVDEEWFRHAEEDTVFGMTVSLCPAEEMIWSKAYVMERERFDGADVLHVLRARAEDLDWTRLIRRFGPHWRVLLAHLVLFGFSYPSERSRIPAAVMEDLLGRLREESGAEASDGRVCQGTLLSRSQYLIDLHTWGYEDARLEPRGPMTREDVAEWTGAIDVDGTR